ncbi:hypothetical protein LCGC14_0791690 [marine sediment metagenome]|uniref:Uncharacterized protein n=1 Tax=marine sediment metagenome TaxID=412755 RepID=A0A0F9SZH8_9ZZZZ
MAQAFAIGAPSTEEVTAVGIGGVTAGITGVVEGVIVKMAPKMGSAAPILTWGTLLGVPLMGAMGALFTRGLLGNMFQGMAAGGTAILGYALPELVAPTIGRKTANPTPEQIAALAASGNIKQLPAGPSGAAQRAQIGVKSTLEF